MAKDPAFLFYPGDWMGGTQWMTMEQKGCYMELLILQFNTGGFTEAQAKQVLSICFDIAWPVLKQKFVTNGTVFKNERLHEEIEKRKNFTESRRINGLSRKGGPKLKENINKHMPKHMENENENENSNNKGTQKNFIKPTIQQISDYLSTIQGYESKDNNGLASEIFDKYESKGWMIGSSKMKDWKASVRNWVRNIQKFSNGQSEKNTKGGVFYP